MDSKRVLQISFRAIKNILVVAVTAVLIFGLGVYTWDKGQDDLANRWCAAFNTMFDSGHVVDDEIFCESITRFPLSPASERTRKDTA